MSALAHYLEEEGVASVAIALVRPQAEKTRPPRALWVPFELGRPFGPPSDPAFQKQVILAALGLLEAPRDAGPVLISDFAEDDPREAPDPHWRPPVARATELREEIIALAEPYARSRAERRRTTVGLSGMSPDAAADYVAAWLRGPSPASPIADASPVLALRFAVDDLKAYALEAAIAGGARPSSRQLGDWLWNETATGVAVRQLRQRLMADEDERAKLIGSNFLVPGLRVTPAP